VDTQEMVDIVGLLGTREFLRISSLALQEYANRSDTEREDAALAVRASIALRAVAGAQEG
jgi:hypothetical protein